MTFENIKFLCNEYNIELRKLFVSKSLYMGKISFVEQDIKYIDIKCYHTSYPFQLILLHILIDNNGIMCLRTTNTPLRYIKSKELTYFFKEKHRTYNTKLILQ